MQKLNQGARTDKITETVLATAGVTTVDELRAMSVSDLTANVWTTASNQYTGWVLSWSSGVGQPTDGSLPEPGTVRSLSPEGPYQPIVDGITYTDLVMYKFRRGEIRPNTPMAWSVAKSWVFNFLLTLCTFRTFSYICSFCTLRTFGIFSYILYISDEQK